MTSSAEPLGAARRGEVVYLVRSWPRLSQTFVLDEALGMERLGVSVRIVALSAPGEDHQQAELQQLRAPVHHLGGATAAAGSRAEHARALMTSPGRYLRAVWHVLRRPGWDRAYHADSHWRCLGHAVRLAALLRETSGDLPAGGPRLHAHFAHDPAAVASLTHILTRTPWSFTAHARDLWQVPPAALIERVRSARLAVTCSQSAYDYLTGLLPAELTGRVRLVRHGVDVDTFRPAAVPQQSTGGPVSIVTVGRLIEKKGFDDLFEACRLLADRGLRFHCTVYGEGPLGDRLAEQVRDLGLSDLVTLAGTVTRSELLPRLQQADVFALTPYVTPDGDRDGIPNVVVEAMACGLPVVATTTGGIPEIVQAGVNGLLAPPRDVPRIADRLATLVQQPALRSRLGAAARRTAVEGFDARASVAELAGLLAPSLEEVPG